MRARMRVRARVDLARINVLARVCVRAHREGGIPHERRRYKVVQVHRVNGSSELIHAGWPAAFRYARRGAARLAENALEHGNRINRVMLIRISSPRVRSPAAVSSRVAIDRASFAECRALIEFSFHRIEFFSFDAIYVRRWKFFLPS